MLSGTELGILAAVTVVPLLFAILTNNAWEDWYITYRASKNLAQGFGLVFTPGQRVHSFTSPLGTLIPAVLAYATACHDDGLVLWLYRLVNSLVLGVSGVLLFRLARAREMGLLAAMILIGMLAIDPKVVAFSINGMETAFLVFFLVLGVYAVAVAEGRRALLLGASWGGLMLTRPDGFIYGGAVAAGFWLFPRASYRPVGRAELLRQYVAAAAVAGVLYAPWFFWAWSYYGTPVPHTIVAKGLHRGGGELMARVVTYPPRLFTLDDPTFLPAYHFLGGWKGDAFPAYRYLTILCLVYWLLPWARPLGRAVSFAFLLAHFYLSAVVPFGFPWYWPAAATLAVIVLAEIAEQVASWARARLPRRVRVLAGFAPAAAIMIMHALLLAAVVYQIHWQQAIIEDGNRKQIGLWLKEHASSPRDTVLMECLGYIGFFSGLKTYDIPGMSSPEVVASRRRLGPENDTMGSVLRDLRPDWAVLRPGEAEAIRRRDAELLSTIYRPARVFDVSSRVKQVPNLPGRNFLEFDQRFIVYRRVASPPQVGTSSRP